MQAVAAFAYNVESPTYSLSDPDTTLFEGLPGTHELLLHLHELHGCLADLPAYLQLSIAM